ncbi:MAG TPA: cysteine--tRNA ligase [Acidobacteriota bacterium]|nr:cysteine--tRNA ligase [Acidobacteriota bacterium]
MKPRVYLYNTLTRTKQPFTPLDGKKCRMYTCGPTVYHFAHIGNLRTYVFEDVLKRVLVFQGIPTYHVMNITDVGHLTSDADSGEDKMEKGARREGKSVWDIAKYYTDAFFTDLDELHILKPDVICKATDHIAEQIAQIQQLEAKGFTYTIEDGVYFDTSKFSDYGKMAKLDIANLKAGIRVEIAKGKKNPTDFALWKFSPKDGAKRAMEWDSPWGVGFPGWHIECSAMAVKYLGNQFDIHCGGIDHVQVHHTNEIAQAEAALSVKPWVKFWLHGEFLSVKSDSGDEKMAKSGDNFLTISVLKKKNYWPLSYRYFLLQAHYRKQLAFNFDALDAAQTSLKKLYGQIVLFQKAPSVDSLSEQGAIYEEEFVGAITDDLNTPQAVAVMHKVVSDPTLSDGEKWKLLSTFDVVFGLDFIHASKYLATEKVEVPAVVQALLDKRAVARSEKDFKKSDDLRDEILAHGYIVKDSKTGQTVTKK